MDAIHWRKRRASHSIDGHPRQPLPSAPMRFHDITMTSITGEQVDFADFEGKLALVVNVASA